MISKQNVCTILAVFWLIMAVTAASRPILLKHSNDLNLLNLMARSNNLIAADPATASKCFNYYVPIINEIADRFQKQYQACCDTADDQRRQAASDTLASRENLANETEISCAALQQCKLAESVEVSYQCYVDGGIDNAKVMRSISNTASSDLAIYMQKIRVIEFDETQCTSKAQICYEEESIKAYENLDACLTGKIEPPSPTTTPTPTTTTTIGTTSSNEASTEPTTLQA